MFLYTLMSLSSFIERPKKTCRIQVNRMRCEALLYQLPAVVESVSSSPSQHTSPSVCFGRIIKQSR